MVETLVDEACQEERSAVGSSSAPSRPRLVAGALVVGLVLLAVAVGVVLSGAPVVVLGASSTVANGVIATTTTGAQACQTGEALPAGTSAIRLALAAEAGPRVSVSAQSGARVLTGGSIGSGWTGGSVSVPVRRVGQESSNVRVCFDVSPSKEAVGIVGAPTLPSVAVRGGGGEVLPGRMRIEYLSAGRSSWWSVAPGVARRLGLGHAPSGGWVAILLVALMGAVVAVSSWLVLKELR